MISSHSCQIMFPLLALCLVVTLCTFVYVARWALSWSLPTSRCVHTWSPSTSPPRSSTPSCPLWVLISPPGASPGSSRYGWGEHEETTRDYTHFYYYYHYDDDTSFNLSSPLLVLTNICHFYCFIFQSVYDFNWGKPKEFQPLDHHPHSHTHTSTVALPQRLPVPAADRGPPPPSQGAVELGSSSVVWLMYCTPNRDATIDSSHWW